MSKKFLIKFESNFADEFDVKGFWVDEGDSASEIEVRALESFERNSLEDKEDDDYDDLYPVERYFGTNEYLEFDSASDYLSCLDIQEITDEEYNVLIDLFDGSFGEYF